MVSIIWATIALSLGLLIYLLPPMLAVALPVHLREKIGTYYYKQSLRSFRQVAFVSRLLGGYELHPISVDDEQKLAQVTLSSGLVSDDKKLPFKDPDARIKRLFSKPVAIVQEEIPAAIDAELAEMGYWVHRHDVDEGLVKNGKINPYIKMKDTLRLADPLDLLHIVPNDVEPENIETAKQLTRKRFEKYGSRIGMAETLATATGFAFGIAGVAALRYFNQNIMDNAGGGGGAPSAPIPLGHVLPQVPVGHVSIVADALVGGVL